MSEKVTTGYGTCPVCARLKHVTPESTLRLHNQFSARGTVVSAQRCTGSGAPSLESAEPPAASA